MPGSLLGVVGIHEGSGVAGDEHGSQEGVGDDGDDDDGGDDGGLGLAEADPGILQIADGLVVELLVTQALALVDEGKLLCGDIHVVLILSHIISLPF